MPALIDDLLNILHSTFLIKSTRIVSFDESPSGQLEVKIRCRLPESYQFQIWLHQDATSLDYAYQLFTDVPLLRWDNAPHYPGISTSPHHFHDENNRVSQSPLTGTPSVDLRWVLAQVETWLKSKGAY